MATPRKHTPPPRWSKSSGNATFGLIRDPAHVDRMAPVLKLIDDRGGEVVIQLTHHEIANLGADAAKLYTADQEQVAAWWEQLAEASGRSRLPKAHISLPDATDPSAARAAAGTAT